jgi:hypothetical protein
MPNPDAIVARTIRFDPPLDRTPAEQLAADGGLTVELDGERRVPLDPRDPRSVGFVEILDGLRELRRPVYLDVDPVSGAITRLVIPLVGHVVRVDSSEPGFLGIELTGSQAVHRLRLGTPDAPDLERRIRDALDRKRPLIVIEDDSHLIFDLRDYTPGPDDGPLPPFPAPIPELFWPLQLIRRWLLIIWWWPYWPWWWFWVVSMTHARWVFDQMKATNCAPLTASAPCIPFMYPDNGCWARANEMCRLMAVMGEPSRKVWITRSPAKPLHASTRNHPQCFIEWYWHVAPTILVRGPWFFQLRRMVIDPSLATGPITKDQWRLTMQDAAASLQDTDAAQYSYMSPGSTDPTYAQTNADLQTHRLLLKARSLQIGPPPYANCP